MIADFSDLVQALQLTVAMIADFSDLVQALQ
jgi:hypothetical protein